MGYYSRTTEVALAAFAGNRCYFPTCEVPVVVKVEGEPFVNVQRAHIRARKFKGPRHLETMTARQRDDWANLLLLCHPHHTLIDKRRPDDFSVEKLEEWKRQREGENGAALRTLGSVGEERLQQIVTDGVSIAHDRLERAIDRLEELGEGALADTVRVLGEKVAEMQSIEGLPSNEAVWGLMAAADMLSGLHRDAPLLLTAADMLGGEKVDEKARSLLGAAEMLDAVVARRMADLQTIVARLEEVHYRY